jgi:quercetin dioxygenase-like cupin family protein
MSRVFPEPIKKLPEADLPIDGVRGYLSQSENHQIVFVEFEEDIDFPEHSHDTQWEIVLEGEAEVSIDGIKRLYKKGDRFYIPKGVKHSAKVYSGYSAIMFFNQKDRYKQK